MTRALLLALLLSSCSMVNYSSRPADFPTLIERLHQYDTSAGVRDACGSLYEAYGQSVPFALIACSHWRFDTLTCDVYVQRGDEGTLEHERGHCRGYDHYGESTIADAWRAWSVPKRTGLTQL